MKKIYFCHSSAFDYQKDLYDPIRNSNLSTEYEVILPHEDTHATLKTKDIIKGCDMVVAEVSYPATGMGIELGWADSYGVPIVCVYKNNAKLSSSLKFITDCFIEYSDAPGMITKVESYLSHIDET